MKQITEIRCSQLSRPMTCAGSLYFDIKEEEAGEPARNGTAYGELVERLVTNQEIPTHAKNGVAFDSDMKFYAQAEAKAILEKAQGNQIFAEERVDWMTDSGIKITGSLDVAFWVESTLHIEDNKFGWNLVDVFENWQILGYAIGKIIKDQKAAKKIVLTIRQPRPHHEDGPVRHWELDYNTLLGYKEQIEDRMRELKTGEKSLVSSKKCKYCPAAAEACTAFNKAMYAGIDQIMSDFKQDFLTDKELGYQLDLLTRAGEILKIKLDSLQQLAINRIRENKIIPGYMTENSFGNREWKNDVSAEVIQVMTGIDITEKIMLSPAKAEKIGVSKELVNQLTQRYNKGFKLVPKDASKLADKVFGGSNVSSSQ